MMLSGSIAALITPRTRQSELDGRSLHRLAENALVAGCSGICVNGASGEYFRSTVQEIRSIVELARSITPKDRFVIAGCGAPNFDQAYALAAHALDTGADAVLAPAPHFFPYQPEDVAEYYLALATRLRGPVLIYNLPQFTSGLPPELIGRLVRSHPWIIGVKDSSGSLSAVRELSSSGKPAGVRLAGHDAVLAAGLREGVLDGSISGIAGVVPELNVRLSSALAVNDEAEVRILEGLQKEFVEQLGTLPVPWGLKLIAAHLGLDTGALPMPLSGARRETVASFLLWWEDWRERAAPLLGLRPAEAG